MNGKKVLGFLVMKPAWSTRNITSLALVALFFGVYVAAGGKITAVPKVKQGTGFGTLGTEATTLPADTAEVDAAAAKDPVDLDALTSSARTRLEEKKPLSLQEEEFSLKPKRIDERPLNKKPAGDVNAPVAKNTGEPVDDLSDIEARLNIGRKGTK